MDPARLPRLAYTRELSEAHKKFNWARGIKEILEMAGLGYVWESGHTLNVNSFIKFFRQRLRDIYIQDWENCCDSSGKFTTYRSFKVNFGYEAYYLIFR